MSLEAQNVDTDTLRMQKNELTKNLIDHLNKKFWTTDRSNKQGNLRQKLIDHLKKNK